MSFRFIIFLALAKIVNGTSILESLPYRPDSRSNAKHYTIETNSESTESNSNKSNTPGIDFPTERTGRLNALPVRSHAARQNFETNFGRPTGDDVGKSNKPRVVFPADRGSKVKALPFRPHAARQNIETNSERPIGNDVGQSNRPRFPADRTSRVKALPFHPHEARKRRAL